jgi:glucose-6-phosphate isomerase
MLIALFERAVGFYASLVNVNAYHQPGVESGKKAAANIIRLQLKILVLLTKNKQGLTVAEIAKEIDSDEEVESIFKICEHLSSSKWHKIKKITGNTSFNSRYFSN